MIRTTLAAILLSLAALAAGIYMGTHPTPACPECPAVSAQRSAEMSRCGDMGARLLRLKYKTWGLQEW